MFDLVTFFRLIILDSSSLMEYIAARIFIREEAATDDPGVGHYE